MAHVRLKGLRQVYTKGAWYVYAWRGGPRIWRGASKLEEIAPDHPVVAAYHEARRGGAPGETFGAALDAWERSPAFTRLAASTQDDYRIQLKRIRAAWATLPLKAIEARRFRAALLAWRDGWAEPRDVDGRSQGGLRAADKLLATFGTVCAWAMERGLVAVNPAADVRQLHEADLSDDVWGADELARMEEACRRAEKLYVWRAVELAHLTGLARSDLVALPKSAVRDDRIDWRRRKTRRPILIPLYPKLRAALARCDSPPDVLTVLANSRGRPWTPDGFDTVFGRLLLAAKVEKRFHDLRGTAATEMIAAGLTYEEAAMVLGWEVKRVEQIARRYVSGSAVISAAAARLQRRGEKS